MGVKNIRRPPVQAVSAEVAKALKAATYRVKSDTFTAGTSTQPALLFNVPKNTAVRDIVLHVTESIVDADADDYLVVGTSADTDMFHASSDATLEGSHSMLYGAALYAGGRETSTGAIQVIAHWTTGATAGSFWAEIWYSPFADEAYVE